MNGVLPQRGRKFNFFATRPEKQEIKMKEHDSKIDGRPCEHKLHRHFDDEMNYLLSGEEQLLQSLTTHAPLTKVLNRICSALDSQIGNVVSLISLPGDDPGDHAAIGMAAARFGLHPFCSEGVVAKNDEVLGSLEMYCCVPRSPTAREFQLIERAKCLAVIAIKFDKEADDQGHCGMRRNRPVLGRVLEWPGSMN